MFFQIQDALSKQLEQEIVDLFGVGVLLLEEEREENFGVEHFTKELIDLLDSIRLKLTIVITLF